MTPSKEWVWWELSFGDEKLSPNNHVCHFSITLIGLLIWWSMWYLLWMFTPRTCHSSVLLHFSVVWIFQGEQQKISNHFHWRLYSTPLESPLAASPGSAGSELSRVCLHTAEHVEAECLVHGVRFEANLCFSASGLRTKSRSLLPHFVFLPSPFPLPGFLSSSPRLAASLSLAANVGFAAARETSPILTPVFVSPVLAQLQQITD